MDPRYQLLTPGASSTGGSIREDLSNRDRSETTVQITNNFFEIAEAAAKLVRNSHSKPVLDNFFQKLKLLEDEWFKFGIQMNNMKLTNKKLKNDVHRELNKSFIYQKRLQFIQQNQENFERLKQVYTNMKYIESTGRVMVEVREKLIQTDEEKKPNTTDVSAIALEGAKKTLQDIKEMVEKREINWVLNQARDNNLQMSINTLKNENIMLTRLLKAKVIEQETAAKIKKHSPYDKILDVRQIIDKLDEKNRNLTNSEISTDTDTTDIITKKPKAPNKKIKRILPKTKKNVESKKRSSSDLVPTNQKPKPWKLDKAKSSKTNIHKTEQKMYLPPSLDDYSNNNPSISENSNVSIDKDFISAVDTDSVHSIMLPKPIVESNSSPEGTIRSIKSTLSSLATMTATSSISRPESITKTQKQCAVLNKIKSEIEKKQASLNKKLLKIHFMF